MHLAVLLGHLLCLGDDILDVTDHVEGRLGQAVVLAREDLLEGGDGVGKRDELALNTGEDW